MNGKGDKPRFYPDEKYRDNYDRIFKKKENTMDESLVTPEMYLQMWLSEQIMPKEWYRILKERPDVKAFYQKHLEKANVEHKSN